MAKREEADSGLRAGFITEDEALRQRREWEARASLDAFEIPEKPEKAEDTHVPDVPSPDENLKDLPVPSTIEIQGISGKIIPGVIKIVKKPKPEIRAAEPPVAPEPDRKITPEEAVPPAIAGRPETEAVKAEEETEAKTIKAAKPKAAATSAVKSSPEPLAEHSVEKPAPSVKSPEVPPADGKAAEKVSEIKEEAIPASGEMKEDKVTAAPAAKSEVEVSDLTEEAGDRGEKSEKPPVVGAEIPADVQNKPGHQAVKVRKKETARPSQAEKQERVPQAVRKREPQQPSRPARRERVSIAERSIPITERITTPEPIVPQEPARRQPLTTSDGHPIRPQRGSYVGSDRDSIPLSERESRRPVKPSPSYPREGRRPSGQQGSDDRRPGRSVSPDDRRGARSVSPDDRRSAKAGVTDSREQGMRQTRQRRQPSPAPAVSAADALPEEQRSSIASRRQRDRGRQKEQELRDRQSRREQQETIDRSARLRRRQRTEETETAPKHAVAQLTHVVLPEHLTVKELAEAIKKTTADVIMKLMGLGMMVTINQDIDYETAEIIVSEFGITSEKFVEVTEEDILFDESVDDDKDLKPRPPVVVVMGHVDHGKTSILDYIRESSVTAGEAGGITQHIGAYSVKVNGRTITFLDTPGHEAFTTLRARGAQVTDIAILVVAADDGVMPQTIEAINHARAANTEIIVAINKIDRPEANVERVKRELSQYSLMDSDWGGQTTIVPVSAKTGQNMDELLEMILLTADVLELKANPNRQAKGTVIEAKLDKTRGPLATVLIQRGTLHQGDTVVVGSAIGRVRMMYNDRGQPVESAGPSTPVEIIGLDDVPEGGDTLYQVENERVAHDLVAKRKTEERESALRQSSRMSLDTLFTRMAEEDLIDLNIILKADTQGSVEAMTRSMTNLSNNKIRVNVIHGAVGAITESDIRLAEVSDAIIIGFNVRPAATAAAIAADSEIDIRLYRVIYEAIEEIEQAMKGMLAPVFKEVVVGHAEVRNVFHASAVGTIAGCYINEGRVNRNDSARLVRDGIVIYETKLASLRRFKDDVREVAAGYECGLSLERFNDIKIGDEIEFYTMKEVSEDA